MRLGIGIARGPETTYELQGKASPLLWVPHQPNIFKRAQSDLVLVVHSVYRDSGVVQQSNRPELGDGLQNSTSLLQERSGLLLREIFCWNPILY